VSLSIRRRDAWDRRRVGVPGADAGRCGRSRDSVVGRIGSTASMPRTSRRYPGRRVWVRHTVQMIFQDPYSTLNPRPRWDRPCRAVQRSASSRQVQRRRRAEAPGRVSLPSAPDAGIALRWRTPARGDAGPSPCNRRCSCATAGVGTRRVRPHSPEPVPASSKLRIVPVHHAIAVVRQVADRIYVLYRGEVVEHGSADEILSNPTHWYTRRLMESVPGASARTG
jgi:peptide/nickel transport system ATP-binding protein